jgi:hypothetical protein
VFLKKDFDLLMVKKAISRVSILTKQLSEKYQKEIDAVRSHNCGMWNRLSFT